MKTLSAVTNQILAIRNRLIEPKSSDEDARRREYILNIILVGSIGLFVILGGVLLNDVLLGSVPSASVISFGTFLLFPAFFIFLYALSRRGFFVLASYLLIGAYFLGNAYAVYRWGATVPTAMVGFALLIVIASILISTRFAFSVALAIAVVVLPLWYLQLHGIMIADEQDFTDGDGVALVALYCLITIVAWLSNREIEKSLIRARKSEDALRNERDLLEVRVMERTRELQLAQLEKINHLSRFAEFGQLASGLFHDLTSILNALTMQIEQSTHHATKDSLESANNIHREIVQFTESVRKQLHHEEVKTLFSLNEIMRRVVQLTSHQCHAEGIRLSCDFAEGEIMTFGSADKFHQVVINLVTNAIEAFHDVASEIDGRKIKISLATIRENIFLKVCDNACGISAEVLPMLFEPFFTTKNFGKQGVGIGLAITKQIIEKDFEGSIFAENNSDGGATFTVQFPLKREPIFH